ncbi:MAG TPA: hypothetical protein VMU28_13955 [Terriglobales bacterium]|nr:hypothetical protein [Terriglobales bacterium]
MPRTLRPLLLVLPLLTASALPQASPRANSAAKPEWKDVIGTWEGSSTCAVANSPCHDEQALYRIKQDRSNPDKLQLEGFKVVNNRPEFMGDLECNYAADDKVLTCSDPAKHGIWTLHVTDTGMDGTVTVGKEKTVYRKITLQKKHG